LAATSGMVSRAWSRASPRTCERLCSNGPSCPLSFDRRSRTSCH
jgi:hypothetical protein